MNNDGCQVYRFTLGDKLLGQLVLNAGILIGAYGMWLSGPWPALAYLAYAYGGLVLITRYTVCPRCPHLLEADSCLFMPVGFVRRVISDSRTGPLRPGEKVILYTVFGGIVLIPIYWLLPHLWLLGAYLLVKVATVLAFDRHLCRKCRNDVCPLNKPEPAGEEAS